MSDSSKKLFFLVLFALVSISVALLLIHSRRESPIFADSADVSSRIVQERKTQFARLEAKEKKVAETVWGKEILAQECGRTFQSLWDSLNAATNKLNLLASFPVGEIVLGKWNPPQTLPHEIELREPAGPGPMLTLQEWRRFIAEFEHDGWELAQTEFRHNRFETDEAGQPRQSHFYFSAHLTNHARPDRAILEGDLVVDWAAKRSTAEPAAVKRIDASRLTIKTRHGEPPFQPILAEKISPTEKSNSIDPLILYDLDGDGLSEIILAANNVVYRRQGEGHYEPEPLCRYPPGLIFTGVIADFDGDGAADFLCAKSEGLVLFKGSPQGSFDEPGRLVWPATPSLKNAMVLACGDIDHDGDLDVFLGQYKVPTLGQVLKPNYYNANDGFPSYLLRNDGQGNSPTRPPSLAWRRNVGGAFTARRLLI